MRLEALIIFSIEWNSEELILRGKQLKYWSRKLGSFSKKMRLDALIIFSIEWNSEELILRGKQLKYWSRKLGKFHTKSKNPLFFKIALNRLLTLGKDRSRREILESSGIIDLQNNRVLKQFKHWNFRISVPMSYIVYL